MKQPIYTLGHSTHPIDAFVGLLRRHEVDTVVDVRSSPQSRFNPQYNRAAFEASLSAAGVRYVFLGRELGARSEDPSVYVRGKAEYGLIARTKGFLDGVDQVSRESETRRQVLVCAERDPLACHRTILVGRHLAAQGHELRHILADGALEAHADAMTRLVREVGLREAGLFPDRAALEQEAYDRRGALIAYVVTRPKPGPTTERPGR